LEDRGVALRVRLQRSLRTTQSQHEKLHEIHVELDRAIASRETSEIAAWTDRLGEALHSHFDLEQRVVFPTMSRMSPSAQEVVSRLESEHATFLADLQHLHSDPEEAERALPRIRERLRSHEETEERLIAEALRTRD
jgi:iron-sulfur cluster repair protein YtfE (RIC family)